MENTLNRSLLSTKKKKKENENQSNEIQTKYDGTDSCYFHRCLWLWSFELIYHNISNIKLFYLLCYFFLSLSLPLLFFFSCSVLVRLQTLGLALATYHCFQLAILSLTEKKIMPACWGESTVYFRESYEKGR